MSRSTWLVILVIVVGLILLGLVIGLIAYLYIRRDQSTTSTTSTTPSFPLPATTDVTTSLATRNGKYPDGAGSYTEYTTTGEGIGCSQAFNNQAIGFKITNNSSNTVTMYIGQAYGNSTCSDNGMNWGGQFIVDPGQTQLWNSQIISNAYFTFYPNCRAITSIGSINRSTYIGNVNPTTQYLNIIVVDDNTVTMTPVTA